MALPPKKPTLSITVLSGKGLPPVADPDAPEPDADDTQNAAPSDNDADDQANVTPEQWDDWLDYTGPDERCQECSHMGQDGFCPIVKHAVDPQGNCHGFEAQSTQTGEPSEGEQLPS